MRNACAHAVDSTYFLFYLYIYIFMVLSLWELNNMHPFPINMQNARSRIHSQ